ncbi:hypothetical protein HYQ46_006918 [Verticillium longisporum]|nr:hypothetical protein HYQ46_006918 [Verticillium longisporum]
MARWSNEIHDALEDEDGDGEQPDLSQSTDDGIRSFQWLLLGNCHYQAHCDMSKQGRICSAILLLEKQLGRNTVYLQLTS